MIENVDKNVLGFQRQCWIQTKNTQYNPLLSTMETLWLNTVEHQALLPLLTVYILYFFHICDE